MVLANVISGDASMFTGRLFSVYAASNGGNEYTPAIFWKMEIQT